MNVDQRAPDAAHDAAPALTPAELRERFEAGLSADRFVASLPDDGRRLAELWALAEVDASASPFARLRAQLNVVAILEGWCRDSKDATAVLLRLVGGNPAVRPRFFARDEHPKLMAAYRKDGQFDSIPVFLFLDSDFNEIGRYVERPDEVTRMYAAHRELAARQDPAFAPADAPLRHFDEPVRARLRAALDDLRERARPQANALIAAALDELAERALRGERAGAAAAIPTARTQQAQQAQRAQQTEQTQQTQQTQQQDQPDDGEACPIEW